MYANVQHLKINRSVIGGSFKSEHSQAWPNEIMHEGIVLGLQSCHIMYVMMYQGCEEIEQQDGMVTQAISDTTPPASLILALYRQTSE